MFSAIFELCTDASVTPNINGRKATKAIRKYGDSSLEPDDVLLLIDNTILRSAKQGMFITEDRLFAYSQISGKYSIGLSDIEAIKVEIRNPLRVKIPGITINGDYFVSLPGMGQAIEYESTRHPALLILATFMVQALGCKLITDEQEAGPAMSGKWLPGDSK